MSTGLNLRLNLARIPEDAVFVTEKGNEFLDLTVFISDETDQYGNNASAHIKQTAEEREAKATRNYIGNGAVFYTDGMVEVAERTPSDVKV